MRKILTAGCAVAVALAYAGVAGSVEEKIETARWRAASSDWPLITMRQMYIRDKPEVIRGMCAIHRKYPGAVDEWWLGAKNYLEQGKALENARTLREYAEDLRTAGLAYGFQQGVTLGHGSQTKNAPNAVKFSNGAYQVDVDGKLTGYYCPTSPEVLAYEEWWAEQLVREGKLVSFWLDDDLRLGFYKSRAFGCFCPRCLDLLNRKCGTAMTREEWVKRLSSQEKTDLLRAKWTEFKEESLALYAASARRGAKKANPAVRMAYQAISSAQIITGADHRKILEALSDGFRDTVGIRPGHGYYQECGVYGDLPQKLLDTAREAERCRSYPGWKGTICYEQENYPHYMSQKCPEACVMEAAMAVAAGCDTVALYWYPSSHEEPLEYYEDIVRHAARYRPYIRRLSDLAKRTHLGGVALKPDPELLTGVKNTIPYAAKNDGARVRRDDAELKLIRCGVPVTIAESGTPALFTPAEVNVNPEAMSHAQWNGLLDRLDGRMAGGLPVRLSKFARLFVYPRVDGGNRTVAVTVCNMQIGSTDNVAVKIRRPTGTQAVLIGPFEGERRLESSVTAENELTVRLPDLRPWDLRTVVLR